MIVCFLCILFVSPKVCEGLRLPPNEADFFHSLPVCSANRYCTWRASAETYWYNAQKLASRSLKAFNLGRRKCNFAGNAFDQDCRLGAQMPVVKLTALNPAFCPVFHWLIQNFVKRVDTLPPSQIKWSRKCVRRSVAATRGAIKIPDIYTIDKRYRCF